MNGPRIVCAACAEVEVPFLQIVCPGCRAQLIAAGILKPEPPQLPPTSQPAEVA